MLPLTSPQQRLFNWIVAFVQEFNYPPTVQAMADGLGYSSKTPVQGLRQQLRKKGYITWVDKKPGTLQLCAPLDQPLEPVLGPALEPVLGQNLVQSLGVPLLGTIAAGAAVESFTDGPTESVEVAPRFNKPDYYALRVIGDSMIDAGIFRNDVVILRRDPDLWTLKPKGDIVAALVEGEGTTLKYFESRGDRVRLLPANPHFLPMERPADQVQIQGVIVHLDRDYR